MAHAEENHLIREIVYKAEGTKEETQRVMTYVALKKKPQEAKIKEPKNLKRPKRRELLTRKQTIHLHRFHSHVHHDNIKSVVKKKKMWDENTIKARDDLTRCGLMQLNIAGCPVQG